MLGFLRGTATALVTPFTRQGVSYFALEQMIDTQIKAGVDAIVVLGSTGEPESLSREERDMIVRCAVARAAGRVKVIVGTGHSCTQTAVEYSLSAQKFGADGLLCVTPYYNKCNQSGLLDYYGNISSAVEIPVICYNVPSRTGVNLLPETMKKIATFRNIAGIKEASGNMTQIMETARAVRHKCDLYSGDDFLNVPILAAGGSAVISVLSNLAPKQVVALVRAALSGNLARANKIGDKLFPLLECCFSDSNPIPVKEGLNLLGFEAGLPRPPLTPLSPAKKRKLLRALAISEELL